MEWQDFIQYLAMGYLIYYSLMIIIDLLKPEAGLAIKGEDDVLEFSESIETTIVDEIWTSSPANKEVELAPNFQNEWMVEDNNLEDLSLLGENVNISTGGVSSMQELFKLAQDQSIEIKKQLIF